MKRLHVIGLISLALATSAPARPSWGPSYPSIELAAKPTPPGDWERTLTFRGATRYYELHLPRNAGPGPLPVVLNFHGGGGSADGARRGTGLDATADREHFLIVYPQGLGAFPRRMLTWNAGNCCGRAEQEGSDDVGFVRAILDDLPAFVKIDEKRVYATGFSNGAMLSHRLGCELSERVAAIAPVSGPLGLPTCSPARPVPVLHIHGTADQNAPYGGGNGAHALSKTDFRSVADTLKIWCAANRTVATPVITQKGAVTTRRWAPGPGGAEVISITIEGQGHVWPGGNGLLPAAIVGLDVGALDARDVIWDFFKKHRLDEK